ncbi:potassium channel family protein [Pyrococcus kukulkanii]|uniref:Ion channel n=1 Tax=Pyrococcus kukulkanii TaxID=1609559 RepID=A0ABV4T2E0_9EURY
MLPVPVLRKLLKIHFKLKKSRIAWLALGVSVLAVILAILFMVFEGLDFFTALYWAIITMSTIGYGDVTPTTQVGKIVAMVAAVAGISSFTALVSLIAEYFLTSSLRRMMGMHGVRFKDHYVVIGKGPGVRAFVEEIIAAMERGEAERGKIVAIVESEDEKRRLNLPEEVEVLVGDPTEDDTLKRASIERAKHVILTPEDDSKAVFITLKVKSFSKAKIHVEALREESVPLLKNAGAERVVLSRGLAGRLLASSIFEPEVVDVLEDLMKSSEGHDIVIISDERTWNKNFKDAIEILSPSYFPIGYVKGEMRLAPPLDEVVPQGAKLICITGQSDVRKQGA